MDGADNDGNGYTDDLIADNGSMGHLIMILFLKQMVQIILHGSWITLLVFCYKLIMKLNGINSFNAYTMSIKTSRDGPSTDEPGIWSGYPGILYAAQAGHAAGLTTIINNSWGGGGFSNSEQNTINVAHNTYGAVVVASAGNGLNSGGEQYAAHYPSSYDNVISVCAIGCNGNWGDWATYHPSVDLAAPGESIYSAIMGTGYESWDGSSMVVQMQQAVQVISCILSRYEQRSINRKNLIQQIGL